MLPRRHIILGLVFSVLFLILFPESAWYNIALILFASIFIDFDHYMCAVLKTRELSLPKALRYYYRLEKLEEREFNKGIRRKGDFHVFHTLEFNALVLAAGLVFQPFLYLLLGMVFHEGLDIISLTRRDKMYRREFFLTNWVKRKIGELKRR